MTVTPPLQPFNPRLPEAAGVISWIHIGDLSAHNQLRGNGRNGRPFEQVKT